MILNYLDECVGKTTPIKEGCKICKDGENDYINKECTLRITYRELITDYAKNKENRSKREILESSLTYLK